jgi:hypothetical protein
MLGALFQGSLFHHVKVPLFWLCLRTGKTSSSSSGLIAPHVVTAAFTQKGGAQNILDKEGKDPVKG